MVRKRPFGTDNVFGRLQIARIAGLFVQQGEHVARGKIAFSPILRGEGPLTQDEIIVQAIGRPADDLQRLSVAGHPVPLIQSVQAVVMPPGIPFFRRIVETLPVGPGAQVSVAALGTRQQFRHPPTDGQRSRVPGSQVGLRHARKYLTGKFTVPHALEQRIRIGTQERAEQVRIVFQQRNEPRLFVRRQPFADMSSDFERECLVTQDIGHLFARSGKNGAKKCRTKQMTQVFHSKIKNGLVKRSFYKDRRAIRKNNPFRSNSTDSGARDTVFLTFRSKVTTFVSENPAESFLSKSIESISRRFGIGRRANTTQDTCKQSPEKY